MALLQRMKTLLDWGACITVSAWPTGAPGYFCVVDVGGGHHVGEGPEPTIAMTAAITEAEEGLGLIAPGPSRS